MGRLIDADAFDERVRLDVGLCEEELTEDFKDGISTVLEMMKTAPTVDSVPVIRCGFCRYYNSVGYCALHQTEMSKTDFCSYGKKDDDGNG